MNKISKTLAGQLIFLFVMVIVTTQLIVVIVMYQKLTYISDPYNDYNQVKRVAVVSKTLQGIPAHERQKVLALINDDEAFYNITKEPEVKNPILHKKVLGWFASLLGKTPVYVADKTYDLKSVWGFWFTNSWINQFGSEQQVSEYDETLSIAYSVLIEEGTWLNVKLFLIPIWFFVMTPVIFSSLFSIICVIWVTTVAIKKITAPLKLLSQATDRLGRGEIVEQLKVSGPQELASAIEAFNIMQERLTRFVQDRTLMLAVISHDLRTPITSLRLRVEFIEDDELRNKMIRTLEEMQTMVEACLSFASQENSKEENSNVDLVEILSEFSEESSYIHFSCLISQFFYPCRVVSFKRALRNILQNAVVYGKEATVSLEIQTQEITIIVKDQGPGIPEEDFDKVFKPFVRLSKSRNTLRGSVGLGLSIARSIIHNHGGTISIANTDPGLMVSLTLPNKPVL